MKTMRPKGSVLVVVPKANQVIDDLADLSNAIDLFHPRKTGPARSLVTLLDIIGQADHDQLRNDYDRCGTCGGTGVLEEPRRHIREYHDRLKELWEDIDLDEDAMTVLSETVELLDRLANDAEDQAAR